MRRRNMATTSATARVLVEVPRPAELETEVLDSYEARRKLIETIKEQENTRKEGELGLARNFAKETQGSPINVEAAFQRNEAWRTEDERAGQRIAALTNIRSKVDKLITKHKAENPSSVQSALTKRLEALTKALEEKTDAATDLKEEKEKIEKEIATLTKPGRGYAAPPAPTTTAAKRTKKR
jgi:hypothetical protein